MDPNSMQGGMFPTMGSGVLGLEMSLHHHPHPQSQNPQNPSFLGQNPHPQMSPSPQQEPNFRNPNRPLKPQQLTISDEDEPGLGPEDSSGDKRKMGSSPWQRMKWTDNMVRLLILVVYYIGDEAVPEGGEASGKKKGCTGGGVLQKKGKWKSVSRAMLERGFYVSPQQCEDKFNDLNKRYKRVNDILGKGTACRVVENQSLLDTMDNLTAKKKEEVKKLLNSKHLFFKEMCAYHTSCAGGSSGGCGSGGPLLELAESTPRQQVGCRHSSGEATFGALLDRKDVEETKMLKRGSREEEMDENEDDEDHRDEDEEDDDNNDDDEECSKRAKTGGFAHSAVIQQLSGELASVVHDMSKSPVEKKQWLKNRMIRLEEKRVGFQLEAFELEKQRLKWLKFSSKKEREMEREKLQNERTRLEIDRMLLLLRQKEFELIDHNQTSNISG